jgi:hypothetical protein
VRKKRRENLLVSLGREISRGIVAREVDIGL